MAELNEAEIDRILRDKVEAEFLCKEWAKECKQLRRRVTELETALAIQKRERGLDADAAGKRILELEQQVQLTEESDV